MCLKLDGANGVGALKVQKLLQHFQDQFVMKVEVVNDGSSGLLNDKVGGAGGRSGCASLHGSGYYFVVVVIVFCDITAEARSEMTLCRNG